MPNLPDFTPYGYQTLEILYQNTQGGRITYKAHDVENNQTVVIKQFSFAKKTWDGYKEIEKEINVLQGLNHAGIPQYLNKFDSDDGLCLVQEYINAQPLSKPRSFSAEEIKSIAIQLLEILVYLQERIPPIIHRDIKPENVLVEIPPSPPYQGGNGIRVYLIDFGLARIGNNTMAVSTLQGGTLGFMPPEPVTDLTKASDLYGLGATLICLITNTKSEDIERRFKNLRNNCLEFKDKVSGLSFPFIQWLEKMVKPHPDDRFPNAEAALKTLKSILMTRLPEVQLSLSAIELQAKEMGQKLTQTITIENRIYDTVLEGNWSVASHQNDPPHTPDGHKWISFSPKQFKGNKVNCEVKVDTSKLKADENYEREIVLFSNAKQEEYPLKVKVKTAKFLNIPLLPPYGLLVVSGLVLALISGILGHGHLWINDAETIEMLKELGWIGAAIEDAIRLAIFGAIFGAISMAIWGVIDVAMGVDLVATLGRNFGGISGAISMTILGGISMAIFGVIFGVILREDSVGLFGSISMVILVAILVGISGEILGGILGVIFGGIFGAILEDDFWAILVAILGGISGGILGVIFGGILGEINQAIKDQTEKILTRNFYDRGFKDRGINFYVLTTTAVGILTGLGAVFGFNPLVLTGLGVSGIPLAWRLIMPPLKLRKLKAEYPQQESQNLIDS